MNRILEFSPSQEEAVVSRILVLVHQAVDEHFPSASTANRQFTKTVFSADEQTGGMLRAAPSDSHPPAPVFAESEDTSPLGRPADSGPPPAPNVPPPPVAAQRRAAAPAESAQEPKSSGGPGTPVRTQPTAKPPPGPVSNQSRATGLETTMKGTRAGRKRRDWVTRITLALLVAGLVILAYVLFL